MGRPINKKYFIKGGPQNPSNAIQYEGVTVSINAAGAHYSKAATASFSAPQDAAGTQATLSLSIALPGSGGGITAATIGNVGSGYNVAPTVTINKPAAVNFVGATSGVSATNTFTVSTTAGISIGMLIAGASTGNNGYVSGINGSIITTTVPNNGSWASASNLVFSDAGSGATFTVGLTYAVNDTGNIACSAYVAGGSSAVNSAIIKQEGSHNYLVENNQGRGRCKLVAAAPGAGEMTIVAKDSDGNQYYVTKLTSRKVRLQQKSGSNYQFADGSVTRWVAGWSNAVAGISAGVQTY